MNSADRFKQEMYVLEKNSMENSVRNHQFFSTLADEELFDQVVVDSIVSKIKAYDEYPEKSNNKYPESIMQAVRQSIGLHIYDFSQDSRINEMREDDVLNSVCIWNGLPGGSSYEIKKWIQAIYKVELGKGEDLEDNLLI